MRVIGFLNQKGGCGKTTLAINVADCLARKQHKVLLVDADAQKSASNWYSLRETPSFFSIHADATDKLHQRISKIGSKFDYVVIDSSPRVEKSAQSAALASDIVLIPVQPSAFDLWAANETLVIVSAASEYKPVKAYFVLNRFRSSTVMGKETIEVLGHEDINRLGASTIDATIPDLQAFVRATSSAQTVFELGDKKAIESIEQLTKGILTCLP